MNKENNNMKKESKKNNINGDLLMTFANALSTVQKKQIEALNNDEMLALSLYTKRLSVSKKGDKFTTDSSIYNGIGKKYLNSFMDIAGVNTITTKSLSNIANLHLDGIIKLSQSIDSQMVKEVSANLSALNYSGVIKILNKTLEKKFLSASDISFFKTAKIIDAFKNEIYYPAGLVTALKTMNASTANNIANNKYLEFDLNQNRFVSKIESLDGNRPNATTKEMNVICSAVETFESMKIILNERAENNKSEAEEGEFIEEIELMDFMNYLFRTPNLGIDHSAGKKIMEAIRNIWESPSSNNKVGFDKKFYYHSRIRNKNDAPYINPQMLKAPVGVAGQGRYNHPGRSHYYFSDTKNGSIEEVRKYKNNDQEIQTVKIKPVKPAVILDLSSELKKGNIFLKYLRFQIDSITNKMPREYLIPCFVSDCCQRIGFEGVKYYGSKSYSNYVCWNDGYFEIEGNVK